MEASKGVMLCVLRKFLYCVGMFVICIFQCCAQTSTGTGFLITSNGYIATNFHVVRGANSVIVRDWKGNLFPANVIRSDAANDLAILKIEGHFTPISLSKSSQIRKGEAVFTLGYPNITLQGSSVKLTEGIISSISGVLDEPNSFQISVPIQPGNSGGPLCNRDGEVIGVVVSKLSAEYAIKIGSTAPEAVNYAIKSNYLLELINTDNNIPQQIKSSLKKGQPQTLSDVVARVESSVVLIISSTSETQKNQSTQGPVPPPSNPRLLAPKKNIENDGQISNTKGLEAEKLSRFDEAVKFFKDSAEFGYAEGQFNLGRMYESGVGGLSKNEIEAVRLFRLSSNQGNANAQNKLGLMHASGRGGLTRDYVVAARLFGLAVNQNHAQAQNNLGWMYENGLAALSKDDREAARLYRLAADQGNANGQNGLAVMYLRGSGGLTKDEIRAGRLFRLAANQGDAQAQCNLGWMYANGIGMLNIDEIEAVRLYRLAAYQGNATAQSNLGWMYELGKGGLVINESEAVRLYRLAAEQGYAQAKTNLGWMYESGRGGLQKDSNEAVRLYREAANQGNSQGQNNLGWMYESGRGGLNKDEGEAVRLYRLAASQGNSDALTNLKRFELRGSK